MTVPKAGEVYFNLGRNASYAAAKRGDIPTIRIGRLLRVPINAMEKKLEQADEAALRPETPELLERRGSRPP